MFYLFWRGRVSCRAAFFGPRKVRRLVGWIYFKCKQGAEIERAPSKSILPLEIRAPLATKTARAR